MFKKINRLSKTSDVQRVFARSRAFFNPLFTVRFSPSQNLSRFTVVVSTKVSKKAVIRNRIKRVAREFLRLRLKDLLAGDYVVIVKPVAAKKEAAEWRRSLEDLLNKSRLIVNRPLNNGTMKQ